MVEIEGSYDGMDEGCDVGSVDMEGSYDGIDEG